MSKPSQSQPVEEEEVLVGPTDIATALRVPVSWVYMKSEAGELPSFRLGRYRRFKVSEVRRWLEARREGAA
jgi:excisionase family DNA binding protein